VIPGPRPSEGPDRPWTDRDRGAGAHSPLNGQSPSGGGTSELSSCPPPVAPVALTRTPRGWTVVSPGGVEHAADLVEGLSLADLVAEELGALVEPDRSARRSARGPADGTEDGDPVDARVAALERTVAQLEHALAARVSTERAIGVLAERNGISARAAFEMLRRDARSHGRPVAELAREVLDGLAADSDRTAGDAPPAAEGPSGRSVPTPGARRPGAVCAPVSPSAPRVAAALAASVTATADVRS
jgi:ANTAR domain